MTVRSRRSRDELRSLVLAAGCEVLLSVEPTLGFEQLSYSAVFNHLQQTQGVRVTHASVHERIWPNQAAFQLDVLKETLGHVADESVLTFTEPIKEALADVDLTTIDGRRDAARTFIRLGQNANWESLVLGDRHATRVYYMSRMSVATLRDPLDDERAELIQVLTQMHNDALRRFADLMGQMCQLLGLRPRPDLGDIDQALETIARSANAMTTGYYLNGTESPDRLITRPTGPGGADEEWRPIALAIWNLLRGAFEFADEGLEPGQRTI